MTIIAKETAPALWAKTEKECAAAAQKLKPPEGGSGGAGGRCGWWGGLRTALLRGRSGSTKGEI